MLSKFDSNDSLEMSIIRKASSEKTKIFDMNIIGSCQYEDNIYMLCLDHYTRKHMVYRYNKYIGMKEICKVSLAADFRLYLKKNTSKPPELLYIYYDGRIKMALQNIYVKEFTIKSTIQIHSNDNEYICSDNILVIIYDNKHIYIYNIEKETIDFCSDYKNITSSNIDYGSKLYLVGEKDNLRYVLSIDCITGNFTVLNGSPIIDYDGFYVYHTFMIDGILHCDIDEYSRICLDGKSGRQFILSDTVQTLINVVINKKGNKMTTFNSEKIREYDIIIGTLFKSANSHEKYHDINIVTKNNDE